ncbi:MAG: hypothetical protein IPG90_18045 [Bacteroidetes bacterium]|nr:hypothetical protein [Bacteroidota bacterium]
MNYGLSVEDFKEIPEKKFSVWVQAVVRLKNAYIIQCDSYDKDDDVAITEIRCSCIPESRSGHDTSGIHERNHSLGKCVNAIDAEVHVCTIVCSVENPRE